MILPGATIGVLGGGQLGRMFAHAASRLGYRVHVYEPTPGCPAGEVAAKEVNAAFEDIEALKAFAAECDVITYEFENVPVEPLRQLPPGTLLRPDPEILWTTQNRLREKTWLRENGIPHVEFAESGSSEGIVQAASAVGFPCVVKTADFGYDGKGQRKLESIADAEAAGKEFAGREWVIEEWVRFLCEVSVIVARGENGETATFPVIENEHENHILSRSIVPARIEPEVEKAAREVAIDVARRFELVGLIGVEMFVTGNGAVLVNEIAPRTHNSGHFSIDACPVSQFEQQLRAICGLPLAKPTLWQPAVMVNLIGNLWSPATPEWFRALEVEGLSLHLYGKKEARSGRKMGHYTVTRERLEDALAVSVAAKRMLAGINEI